MTRAPGQPPGQGDAASIRSLDASDLDTLIQHFIASAAQSGRNGDPINSPYGRDYVFEADAARKARLEGWTKPISEPGWRRSWGLWGDDRIVGHVELHGGALPAGLHRCKLGLAVERAYRRRGHALALMQTCIDWACAEPQLDWMDLGVFAKNRRAVALYQRLGFETVGELPDRFRVDGETIDEVLMARSL